MITIGIPTYRRPESLCNLAKKIIENAKNASILAINDPGDEDSILEYDLLLKKSGIHGHPSFRYLVNEENLGCASDRITQDPCS